MGRDTFNAVLASVPQGATAARVTSKGTHYEPKINFGGRLHWDAPPPMRAPSPETAKLIGTKFGRLTVVGLFDDPNRQSGNRRKWVVRCVCGNYEVRRESTVKAGHHDGRCFVCSDLTKKRLNYEREGSRPITDFFEPVGEGK